MIKTLRTLWAMLVVATGITIAATLTGTYLLTAGIFPGVPMALQGSRYWHGVWIAFDKLWNAILDGDPEETLSSHLGKSTIYGYEVVLWNRWADHTLAWLLHQIDKHHCEKSIDWKVGEPRKPQKLYLS